MPGRGQGRFLPTRTLPLPQARVQAGIGFFFTTNACRSRIAIDSRNHGSDSSESFRNRSTLSTVRWDRALGSETGRRTDHVMLRTLSPNQRSRFLPSTFISKRPPPNANSHLHRPQHSHAANDTPRQTPQPSRPRPCRTAHHNKPCTANDGPWTLPIS